MKPFNLEAAKRGEPLVSRDGRKVIHFHHIETDKSRLPCVVQYEGNLGASWMPDTGIVNSGSEDPSDLFMAPKIVTKYLNVYRSSTSSYAGNHAAVFDNKHDAEENAYDKRVKLLIRAMPIDVEIE